MHSCECHSASFSNFVLLKIFVVKGVSDFLRMSMGKQQPEFSYIVTQKYPVVMISN